MGMLLLAACGLAPRVADDPAINTSAFNDVVERRKAEILAEEKARDARIAAGKAVCAKKGGVGIGMTKEQVYASCWGKPEKVNVTTTAGGDHEQWVYPGYQYVYLSNGVVTSIQTSR